MSIKPVLPATGCLTWTISCWPSFILKGWSKIAWFDTMLKQHFKEDYSYSWSESYMNCLFTSVVKLFRLNVFRIWPFCNPALYIAHRISGNLPMICDVFIQTLKLWSQFKLMTAIKTVYCGTSANMLTLKSSFIFVFRFL